MIDTYVAMLSEQVSIESGSAVAWMSEENYMFRLSAFSDRLLAWYKSSPQGT